MTGIPHKRLGGLYGMYFAIVALAVGWLGPFLQSRGLSAAEIGIAVAILTGSKILAPYLWGALGDRMANRLRVVQWGMLGSLVVSVGLLWPLGFWGICAVLCGFGLFWNAIISQFDTLTLAYLHGQTHRYTSIRVWGSIGFIVMMLASGWWFSAFAFGTLPWVMIAGLVLTALLSLSLPAVLVEHHPVVEGSMGSRLNQPMVWLFLALAASNQFAHGPLNVFFTLYLQDLGYSAVIAGRLWAIGVLAEVALFFALPALMPRLDLRLLFTGSLAIAALRWLGTAYVADALWALVLLQLAHGLTFGAIHAVCIEFMRRAFAGPFSGRGMALYSSVVFGIGGALGALVSGLLWEHVGGSSSFVVMAVVSAVAATLSATVLRSPHLHRDGH